MASSKACLPRPRPQMCRRVRRSNNGNWWSEPNRGAWLCIPLHPFDGDADPSAPSGYYRSGPCGVATSQGLRPGWSRSGHPGRLHIGLVPGRDPPPYDACGVAGGEEGLRDGSSRARAPVGRSRSRDLGHATPSHALERVAAMAVELIGPGDVAGVCVLWPGRHHTCAHTHDSLHAMDDLQHDLDEGPGRCRRAGPDAHRPRQSTTDR
jgi:hypothetical protein